MDSNKTKEEYNKNFSGNKDVWSLHNLAATKKIASRIKCFLNKKYPYLHPKTLLDVGCARGHHTEGFRLNGFESSGFDISEVAISKANLEFPKNNFFVMDGYHPNQDLKYDLIFMKSFSGTNTYDFEFVYSLLSSYVNKLNVNGFLIVSYSTNYSGFSKQGETANWTKNQLKNVSFSQANTEFIGNYNFSHSLFQRFYRSLLNRMGFLRKSYFYLVFKRID